MFCTHVVLPQILSICVWLNLWMQNVQIQKGVYTVDSCFCDGKLGLQSARWGWTWTLKATGALWSHRLLPPRPQTTSALPKQVQLPQAPPPLGHRHLSSRDMCPPSVCPPSPGFVKEFDRHVMTDWQAPVGSKPCHSLVWAGNQQFVDLIRQMWKGAVMVAKFLFQAARL